MKRAVLGVLALSALLTLVPPLAHAKTSTPVWVDSTGKELGPLGFSDSIAQGVVLHLTGSTNSSLWVLVPFGVNGTSYDIVPTYGPTMLGVQYFFTTSDCTGTAYELAPSPNRLKRNSEQNPYPATMGIYQSIYFPFGTPQRGTDLGIASTYVVLEFPSEAIGGPACLPYPPPVSISRHSNRQDLLVSTFRTKGSHHRGASGRRNS